MALQLLELTLGPSHPKVARCCSELARIYLKLVSTFPEGLIVTPVRANMTVAKKCTNDLLKLESMYFLLLSIQTLLNVLTG
jgi:hypothetical protein